MRRRRCVRDFQAEGVNGAGLAAPQLFGGGAVDNAGLNTPPHSPGPPPDPLSPVGAGAQAGEQDEEDKELDDAAASAAAQASEQWRATRPRMTTKTPPRARPRRHRPASTARTRSRGPAHRAAAD